MVLGGFTWGLNNSPSLETAVCWGGGLERRRIVVLWARSRDLGSPSRGFFVLDILGGGSGGANVDDRYVVN